MAVTGAMTGLSAALLSQTYYLSPFSGLTPTIKGVSIALMGGLEVEELLLLQLFLDLMKH